ncbi:MAG TPA: hypothetical protein VFW00_04540 [Rhodocyclaceae bacterium]|nr:hypothetical protein [Rhodocyclaceae bacterium]
MNFVQASRRLHSGEKLPALPGLADQLFACQDALARSRQQPVEDEVELEEVTSWNEIEEGDDDSDAVA